MTLMLIAGELQPVLVALAVVVVLLSRWSVMLRNQPEENLSAQKT